MGEKNEKLKAYETAILQRVECEKRAFDIVNKLIDGVTEDYYLIQCGRLISREHYNDIVEERAITMLCGYPICGNSLDNVPKKKYHISTKTNKVYDISERKNFCSNQCFKASKYFYNQIPESPLWAREKEVSPEIKLLALKMDKGIIGEEIVGELPRQLLKEELSKLEELDTKMSSLHITPKARAKKIKCQSSDLMDPTHLPTCSEVNEALTAKDESIDSKLNNEKSKALLSALGSVDCYGNCESICDVSDVVLWDPKPIYTCPHVASGIRAVMHGSVQDKKENRTSENTPTLATPSQKAESKLEQLQKILARKKGVLSNMIVDMQPTSQKTADATANMIVDMQPSSQKTADATANMIVDMQPTSQKTADATANMIVDMQPACQKTSDATAIPTQSPVKKTSVCSSHGQNQKDLRQSTTENVSDKQKDNQFESSFHLPLQRILDALKGWVTEHTRSYLLLSASEKDGASSFFDPKLQKYSHLCRRLDLQDKEFENLLHGDNKIEDTEKAKLKSVPDYDLLKQENAVFQLKVVEFITGKKPESNKSTDEADDDNTNPVFLPSVDTYDQHQIRMKIVLYQLDKVIPSLLTPLSLPVQFISTVIRELVATFSLQKDTIVFKPPEWTLVAIFLLKMLSRKSESISEAFSADSATRYFTILLTGIGYTLENFDDLTTEILSCNVE